VPDVDVRLERVTKDFGGMVAVDDLSLDIAEGEFFSMLGPSGCGKTTTLRMIGGFEEPTRGTIYLGGRDVTDLPPYKRDVNTVFQSYALFPHLNVQDNVEKLIGIEAILLCMAVEVKDSGGAYPLLTHLAIESVAERVRKIRVNLEAQCETTTVG